MTEIRDVLGLKDQQVKKSRSWRIARVHTPGESSLQEIISADKQQHCYQYVIGSTMVYPSGIYEVAWVYLREPHRKGFFCMMKDVFVGAGDKDRVIDKEWAQDGNTCWSTGKYPQTKGETLKQYWADVKLKIATGREDEIPTESLLHYQKLKSRPREMYRMMSMKSHDATVKRRPRGRRPEAATTRFPKARMVLSKEDKTMKELYTL